jgi:hypothetical protein
MYNTVLYIYRIAYTYISKYIKSNRRMSKTVSIHSPRLNTIKMIENSIRKVQRYSSINQLWRSLPRQVQYPTLKTILKYLEDSNKIMYDKDRSIVWIFADSRQAKKSLERSTKLR